MTTKKRKKGAAAQRRQLLRLLEEVGRAYDEATVDCSNRVLEYGRARLKGLPVPPAGDALAAFIAYEVMDTFDHTATFKEQLRDARRVIRNASLELLDTAQNLE